MMKKLLLPVLSVLAVSPLALAGSVNTTCSNGQFGIELGVSSGETCNVSQSVTINGAAQQQSYTITEDTTKSISLEPTDSASLSVTMSCSTDFGTSSASGSTSTENGCS
jgi:hypothetical protein